MKGNPLGSAQGHQAISVMYHVPLWITIGIGHASYQSCLGSWVRLGSRSSGEVDASGCARQLLRVAKILNQPTNLVKAFQVNT